MKMKYIVCLIIILSVITSCSVNKGEKETEQDKVKESEIELNKNSVETDLVWRKFENAIEIITDNSSILIDENILDNEQGEVYVILVNCSTNKEISKKYTGKEMVFDNLSAGTYTIQAYVQENDEYIDLSTHISILQKENQSIRGLDKTTEE